MMTPMMQTVHLDCTVVREHENPYKLFVLDHDGS